MPLVLDDQLWDVSDLHISFTFRLLLLNEEMCWTADDSDLPLHLDMLSQLVYVSS